MIKAVFINNLLILLLLNFMQTYAPLGKAVGVIHRTQDLSYKIKYVLRSVSCSREEIQEY